MDRRHGEVHIKHKNTDIHQHRSVLYTLSLCVEDVVRCQVHRPECYVAAPKLINTDISRHLNVHIFTKGQRHHSGQIFVLFLEMSYMLSVPSQHNTYSTTVFFFISTQRAVFTTAHKDGVDALAGLRDICGTTRRVAWYRRLPRMHRRTPEDDS